MIRLNKAIADSGYCARRKADTLITNGRVQVNGQTVTELGTKVDPASDRITINGQPLGISEKAYLLFHKPVGYVTSRMAGQKQKSFYELIPPEFKTVDPAGRLDQDSSGALILSSDGDFLHQVTHPNFHLSKIYEFSLDRPLQDSDRHALKKGVLLKPENKLAIMIKIDGVPGQQDTYQAELITGYKRQIRRTFIELGYRVQALHRVSFGGIELGDLPEGAIRPLTEAELNRLLQAALPE